MKGFIIQVRFTKKGSARFLSHRELMTLMERAVRRANIPIKMSEGYNPRPRISFPTALGLGIESEDEVIYLTLDTWLSPQEILKKLSVQLIPGIEITSAEPVLSKELPRVKGIEYEMVFPSPHETPKEEDIKRFLIQPEIWIERKRDNQTKSTNIRKYITKFERLNELALSLSVLFSPQGSVSPYEVLKALGKDGLTSIRIIKTKTLLSHTGSR